MLVVLVIEKFIGSLDVSYLLFGVVGGSDNWKNE